MKELTAAQGLLRCGECNTIFDAMKTLSTTLPEERRFAQIEDSPTQLPAEVYETTGTTPGPSALEKIFPRKKNQTPASPPVRKRSGHDAQEHHHTTNPRLFLAIGVTALALLLIMQLLYSGRNWLARMPLTANLTQQACAVLGCDIHAPRDVSKVNLLSRNVYSHPNTPGILTISLSIQNDASFAQPYPLIEISFLDQQNEVVALRRFTPEEYLKNYHNELMEIGIPKELVLNISDPGQDAIRFQFRFM
jgi:hypothetical protein